jgi:hypothetical protein
MKSCLSGEVLDRVLYGVIQKWIAVTDSLKINQDYSVLYSLFTRFYFSLSSAFSGKLRSQYEMSFVHHKSDFLL